MYDPSATHPFDSAQGGLFAKNAKDGAPSVVQMQAKPMSFSGPGRPPGFQTPLE